MLHEFGVPERLMTLSDGERRLTNLLHLSELLQAAAIRIDGEHALIRWLAQQIEGGGRGSEEYLVRLESDDELVRVVTIHKSKGLEYPLVFLPFICTCRPVSGRKGVVVKYHDEQGRLKLVRNPNDEDIAAAERERLAEDLRLLYVAVTRAQHACWLGVGVIGRAGAKGESTQLHLSGLGYLLSAGQMIACSQLDAKLAALKGDCPHIAISPLPEAGQAPYVPRITRMNLEPAAAFCGHVPRNWYITSYSGILIGAQMIGEQMIAGQMNSDAPSNSASEPLFPGSADRLESESAAPNSAIEDQLQEARSEISAGPQAPGGARCIHLFPRGSYPGTFLHGLLEWAAIQGFAALADEPGRIEERVSILCRRRNWDDWSDVLTDWLRQLLQTPLGLPQNQGRIALAGLMPAQYQPELEFLFAAHKVDTRMLDSAVSSAVLPSAQRPQLRQSGLNGMLKGFIDLVFCHNGQYYLIDYKSNYLGENEQAYSAAAMAQAMLGHRYDLQYVLYVLALHRLLKARLENYAYSRDVGGVLYLFLRGVDAAGHGVYTDKPSQALIERLDDYFAGQEKPHAA
jgi:exodeoxyribonuclease V beta subunit